MYVRKPRGPAWTPTALDIARAEEALRAPKPSYRKKFGHGTQRRRVEEEEAAALTGGPPTNILIEPDAIPEKTVAAIIGIVTVVDADLPNDAHTFVISDSRFEIVDGVFKLKSGQQLLFANETSVTLSVTATDQNAHQFSKILTFSVSEQIVPVVNHAPSDVVLDDLTVSDLTLGAVIGPVVGFDEDLPNDTLVLSVDDSRFVIIAGVLRLKPNKFVSSLDEPTIPLTLRATDAGGLSASHLYTITVADIAAPDLNNAIFIAPGTQGAGTGTSFATAMSFTNIATAITQAAATGKQVLMASHLGNYTAGLRTLNAGGVAGAPVIIRGVDADGNEDAATIVGTRANPWTAAASNQGEEVFRFLAGANHLYFKDIDFQNCGNGCFRFGDNVADVTIDTCNATNVTRFVENNASGGVPTATVTSLHIRNCLVEGFSRSFVRLQYAATGFLIEDCFGDSLSQDGGHFAVGIGFTGTCNSGAVRRTTMRNCIDIVSNLTTEYYNGDGYSTELGNYGIEFTDCVASGNTDGGWDLKGGTLAAPHVLTGCTGFNNKHAFKLWGCANLIECIGLDANTFGNLFRKSHVEINTSAVVNITDCHFADLSSDTIVFDQTSSGTSTLTVVNTSVQKHASAVLNANPSGASSSISVIAAPGNTVLPVITGTQVAGDTITLATPGTWDETVTLTYKYKLDGIPIDDALGPAYATILADLGGLITITEYATDVDGNVAEATSLAIGPITASGIANTVAPSLSGLPFVGGVLTADVGSWSGVPSPTFTVQFKMNGSVVQDSASLTYTVLLADSGKTPKITVHGDNGTSTANADSANYTVIGAQRATAFIRPAAHGTGFADSWANATTWSNLDKVVSTCAPGATVYVSSFAYDGAHSPPGNTTLRHGGTGSDPITVTAADSDTGIDVPEFDAGADISGFITITGADADLTPGVTKFLSNRTVWTLDVDPEAKLSVSGWVVGGDILYLGTGADNLRLAYLGFERAQNCITLIANSAITNLIIDHCTAYNVRRFFIQSATNASLTYGYFTDNDGTGFSKQAWQLRNTSSMLVWDGITLNSGRQYGDAFAVGMQFSETAHHISILNFDISNCDNTETAGDYWNSDGISFESTNHHVLMQDGVTNGHTDGGIDSKASSVIIRRVDAHDSKHNLRLWQSTSIFVDDCDLDDPRSRGGTGHASQIEINSNPSDVGGGISLTIENSRITFAASGIGLENPSPSFYQGTLRLMDNTFTNCNAGTDTLTGDWLVLTGSSADSTAPTITSSATANAYNNARLLVALTANEGVSWSVVGGADQAIFSIADSSGIAASNGQYLLMTKQAYTGIDDTRVVSVRATDVNMNTTDQTVTITVLVTILPVTFRCRFEGANNATAATDEGGGKTISFLGNAKLTTTSPLEGTSSLTLDGVDDRCSVANHTDFRPIGEFSALAKIRPTALAANVCPMGMYATSASYLKCWKILITPAGAMVLQYSLTGDNVLSVTSANGLIGTGTSYEIAWDRDDTGKIRLYIDGAMVVSGTQTSAFAACTRPFVIGTNSNSGTPTDDFTGQIDDVRIWNGYAFCGSDSGYTVT